MTVKTVVGLCLLAIAIPARAEKRKTESHPILVSLQSRLERELREMKPATIFELRDSTHLVMRYKTREYQIYPETMSGRLGADLVKREGPGDEGVLLTVQLQRKGTVNQAAVPQTVRSPYWDTYLNVYPVAGTDRQLYVGLSYRGWTDKGVLKKLMMIFEQQAGEPSRSVKGSVKERV